VSFWRAYANSLYQSYKDTFSRAYGANWQTSAAITNYGAYQNLLANGQLINGTFTLSAQGIAAYRAAATASVGHAATDAEVQAYAASLYTTLKGQVTFAASSGVAFALLQSNGSLQNGTFVLTNTGILAYASNALSQTNYGTFRDLLSNGSLSSGTFTLTTAGVAAEAQSALMLDYQNFTNMLANGTVSGGVVTLNAAGLALFRQAASTAQNPNPSTDGVARYHDDPLTGSFVFALVPGLGFRYTF